MGYISVMAPASRRSPLDRRRTRQGQSGVATLVVVMILFLIVALVAGYTNRNLIFEQRISANQYRSTQALEAAEAGIEWATALLNSGRIDASCQPSDQATNDSFRQRYLAIDANTGKVTHRTWTAGAPPLPLLPLLPSCVFDGADWRCSCPVDADPTLAAPVGEGPYPAYRVQFFSEPGYPPGVVRVHSVGCTRLDADEVCAAAAVGDGRAIVTMLVALKSGLATPPSAGLTARGVLDLGSDLLEVFHTAQETGGLTLHAGVSIAGTPVALHSIPGTPADQSVIDGDTMLAGLADGDRMFATIFGMARDTYRQQPATIVLDCEVDCTAGLVRDLASLNPGRMIWVEGDLQIDIADPIGTVDSPVLLVVNGGVGISNPNARLNGAVYVVGPIDPPDPEWSNTGGIRLNGLIVGESDLAFAGTGTTTVYYDPEVVRRLRNTHGSFVRVPGSWKDF